MRYLVVIAIFQLVLMPKIMADEILGRLFFTSEQRQDLERLRIDNQQHSIKTEAVFKEPDPLLSESPEMKMQGYVKRNDGKQSTLWVNGRTLQEDSNRVFE